MRTTGVTVTKASSAFVLAAGLYSRADEYSNLFISNYPDLYIRDAMRRVPAPPTSASSASGVLDASLAGSRSARGAGVCRVGRLAAIREQNAEIAAGQVGQPPAPTGQTTRSAVNAHGRLRTPEEFADVVLKRARTAR